MSRYAVNKVLWEVARDDAKAAIFKQTTEQFLDGRPLTEDEYRHLLTRDFAGLFAAGAHPFLMHAFNLKVSGGWSPQMMVDYVNALSGIDPPLDIST